MKIAEKLLGRLCDDRWRVSFSNKIYIYMPSSCRPVESHITWFLDLILLKKLNPSFSMDDVRTKFMVFGCYIDLPYGDTCYKTVFF